jgi:hypothetical protein
MVLSSIEIEEQPVQTVAVRRESRGLDRLATSIRESRRKFTQQQPELGALLPGYEPDLPRALFELAQLPRRSLEPPKRRLCQASPTLGLGVSAQVKQRQR